MEGTVRRRYEVGASGLMRRIPEKLQIAVFYYHGSLSRSDIRQIFPRAGLLLEDLGQHQCDGDGAELVKANAKFLIG